MTSPHSTDLYSAEQETIQELVRDIESIVAAASHPETPTDEKRKAIYEQLQNVLVAIHEMEGYWQQLPSESIKFIFGYLPPDGSIPEPDDFEPPEFDLFGSIGKIF